MKKQRQTSSRRRAAHPETGTAVAAGEPAPRSCIDLGSACTLKEIAILRELCLEALAGRIPPVIDGRSVERVDTAGVQLLVGFAIDCMERSIDFSWAGRSPALARAIRLLGVEALLESPGLAAVPAAGVS